MGIEEVDCSTAVKRRQLYPLGKAEAEEEVAEEGEGVRMGSAGGEARLA
jgi:hypothetical protein